MGEIFLNNKVYYTLLLTCLTCWYVAVVPLFSRCCGDAPGPGIPVRVPAVVVVPDPPVVPVVLGPLSVGIWRLQGPLLARHPILGGGGGAAVGSAITNTTRQSLAYIE